MGLLQEEALRDPSPSPRRLYHSGSLAVGMHWNLFSLTLACDVGSNRVGVKDTPGYIYHWTVIGMWGFMVVSEYPTSTLGVKGIPYLRAGLRHSALLGLRFPLDRSRSCLGNIQKFNVRPSGMISQATNKSHATCEPDWRREKSQVIQKYISGKG